MEVAIVATLGEGRIVFDSSVYRAEQPVYTPLIEATHYQFNGEAVDVDVWLAQAPAAQPERPGMLERAENIAEADPP